MILALLFALLGFAANSVLCRLALAGGAIDWASFSTIRLLAGAVTLVVIARASGARRSAVKSPWIAGGLLFLYAIPFSFAYVALPTGTGALILFGTVQATMMLAAIRGGERMTAPQWAGFALACGGLVYLVLPGVTAPDPLGAASMVVAGLAWAFYSLRGRGAGEPLARTTAAFVRAVPMAVVVSACAVGRFHVEARGAALAITSGAIASGLGYVAWYRALKELKASQAAIAQLSVPGIVAGGGVALLGESVTTRLVVAAAAILGGVLVAVVANAATPAAGIQQP